MRPTIRRSLLGGLAGTLLFTLTLHYLGSFLTGEPLDFAVLLGRLMGESRFFGTLGHAVIGVAVIPLLYAVFVFPRLPGRPLPKGMLWGLLLWVLAEAVILPLLGGGFFSAHMGGLPGALVLLAGHLIYGAVLGAVADGPTVAPGRHDPIRADAARS